MSKGMQVLRTILKRLRNKDQGGYADVGPDGKFKGHAIFVSAGLPQATPEELDALFELAGITPDPIKVKGDCGDCVYGDAKSGGDLGWSQPCCSCSRPQMKNFVPLASITKSQLEISDTQAQLLENVKKGVWWAEGVAKKGERSQLDACYRAEAGLKKRGMLVEGMHGRRITNKGERALKNHRGPRRKAA